jgi:transposase
MGRPYSLDLRERVIGAVVKGGLSCHLAARQLRYVRNQCTQRHFIRFDSRL